MVNAKEPRLIERLSATSAASASVEDAARAARKLLLDAHHDGVALTTGAGASNLDTEWATGGPIAHAAHDESTVPAVQAPAALVELWVGMPVWAAPELEQVKDNRGSLRFATRKHDVGIVVGLPNMSTATVVWKQVFAVYSGYKVQWATHADRRFEVERSLLLAANPTPPRKGPSELHKVVRDLKWQQPHLTAKQVLEQICALAPLPEPASLSAVKRSLKLLQQHKRCPFLALLPPDAFTLIANEMPLAALLNLSTTCSEAREILTHTRLERSKVAVEANDRRRCICPDPDWLWAYYARRY